MSLGLDPIVSSVLYSLSLVPHLKRPARSAPPSNREITVLPYVSVLVTFCQETRADIEMTVSSFLAQTYPPDRFEVLIAIEPDDAPVTCYAAESVSRLREAGIAGKIVVSDGKNRIKPHALNLAVKQARANDQLIEQLEADPAMAKTHHRKTWPFKPGWAKEVHVWPFLLRVEFLAPSSFGVLSNS